MPAMTKCPFCGFDGPHGFGMANRGIMRFYHSKGLGTDPTCGGFYAGRKSYRTRLEALEAEILPAMDRSSLESERVWAQAMRADCRGENPKAKRLFKKWNTLALARR